METFGKKLTINLDLKDVQEDRINLLRELLRNYRGDQNLFFYVFDTQEKMSLQMPSRKKKVKICGELLMELKRKNLSYKLN
jgi:DNA polymerase-3 subunit alpha